VLPQGEVNALTRSLAEVLELAQADQLADGYDLLLWGLERAEAVRDEGVLWGDELVAYWQWAHTNYVNQYGIPKEPTCRVARTVRALLGAALAAMVLLGIGLALTEFSTSWPARDRGGSVPLTGASQAGATLQGADLTGVDLRGVNLRGAILSGCSLCNADLRGADLTGADLSDARLDGAKFKGACLSAVDASRARGLASADLTGARYDAQTRWPDGFDPRLWRAVRVKETVPHEAGMSRHVGE
jgi:hypothetical protein